MLAPRRLFDRIMLSAFERYSFDLYTRERLERRTFFYNAFKALRFNGIGGDYAEFGSYGGTTFVLAHREARRHGHEAHLWAFDSFQGLPPAREERDAHPEWREGKMATGLDDFRAICAANGIPHTAYTVVPGFYEETLSAADAPNDIALAYVDCDLYSSATTVLEFLEPRLKHGMIVAFDDYFCWSSSQPSGERQALLDFMARGSRWNWLPYVQIGWSGASFALERVSEPTARASS
jgi:O-methyltransferase